MNPCNMLIHAPLAYENIRRGPYINYVVSVGGRGQKSLILHSKKMTKRGRGSEIAVFETT